MHYLFYCVIWFLKVENYDVVLLNIVLWWLIMTFVDKVKKFIIFIHSKLSYIFNRVLELFASIVYDAEAVKWVGSFCMTEMLYLLLDCYFLGFYCNSSFAASYAYCSWCTRCLYSSSHWYYCSNFWGLRFLLTIWFFTFITAFNCFQQVCCISGWAIFCFDFCEDLVSSTSGTVAGQHSHHVWK